MVTRRFRQCRNWTRSMTNDFLKLIQERFRVAAQNSYPYLPTFIESLVNFRKQKNKNISSPSASTSLIMSWSSASVGFCPSERMTVPSSLVVMVPSPSLSNSENASLNSAICSSVSWSACATTQPDDVTHHKCPQLFISISEREREREKKITINAHASQFDSYVHRGRFHYASLIGSSFGYFNESWFTLLPF